MAKKKSKAPSSSSRHPPGTENPELPYRGEPPYSNTRRNHVFLTMEFNDLGDQDKKELELLVKNYCDAKARTGKRGKPGIVSNHFWVRVIPW